MRIIKLFAERCGVTLLAAGFAVVAHLLLVAVLGAFGPTTAQLGPGPDYVVVFQLLLLCIYTAYLGFLLVLAVGVSATGVCVLLFGPYRRS